MIYLVYGMKIDAVHNSHKDSSVFQDLKEGLRYSYSNLPIRYLLLLVVVTGFFGLPFQVFMPVYAKDILGGGAELLGILTGSMGAGALVGAFYLASQKSSVSIPRIIILTVVVFSLTLMGFAYSTIIPLSIGLMFFMGFGIIASFAATNTLLQVIVDEDKRGRVVSLYGMSFMGITPIGSLLLGSLSHRWGVQVVLFACGFFCLLALILFARKVPLIQRAVNAVVKQG